MTSPVFAEIDGDSIPMQGRYHCTYKEIGCDVLLRDESGAPVLTEYNYGKGTVYFCPYPIEMASADTPGSCSGDGAVAYEKVYKLMKKLYNPKKKIFGDNPYVGITEHPENGITKAVLVNYKPTEETLNLDFGKLKVKEVIGTELDGNTITLKANDCAVIVFEG